MPNLDANTLKKRIISDMRVELADEFDKNFQRKAFFTDKWKARKDPNAKGSLLVVTGTLRRSIQAREEPSGVRFTSQVPYATIHNEGGKGIKPVRAHQRRTRSGKVVSVRAHTRSFNMPQRQFVGDSPETRRIIEGVIDDNVIQFNESIVKQLRK